MRNGARIIAHDISRDRLKLIEENCARLGVTCVHVNLSDTPLLRQSDTVTLPDPHAHTLFRSNAPYDRILVDAPCSNTGVLRRRVEVRWRIKPEEITRLRQVQTELLSHAAPLLKPGGRLVYSTCSLEPEENGEVVNDFLKAQPAFSLQSFHKLTPFKDAVDGAYVATLLRR